MGIDAQIVYITNGCGKVQHLEEINVDMGRKKMSLIDPDRVREFNTKVAADGYSITFKTYDRKAYEQVQSLCRLLVDGKDGEAIPIEWIKEWYKKALSKSGFTGDEMVSVEDLLEDWEKENEQS